MQSLLQKMARNKNQSVHTHCISENFQSATRKKR